MDVNQLLNRFADAQKQMKQMGGMMGLPGMRSQGDQVAEEQAQGHQGRQRRPRAAAAAGRRCPAASRAAMPQLPPGLDPSGLAGGFRLPKLDFSKLDLKKLGDADRPSEPLGGRSPGRRGLTTARLRPVPSA